MGEIQRNRLQRWEDKRRDQMSVANNLLLTFGVAICGYLFDKILNDEIVPVCIIKLGYILVSLSVFLGVSLTVSRLLDYRHTVKKIRAEIKDDKVAMDYHDGKSQKMGDISWVLFWGEIITLTLSMIAFLIFLLGH